MKKAWVAFIVLIVCMMTVGFLSIAEATPPDRLSPDASIDNVEEFDAESFDDQALVYLSWDNPGDPDFDGVIIRRDTGSAPTTVTAGVAVFGDATTGSGKAESYFDETTLTLGTTYYYSIWAKLRDDGVLSYLTRVEASVEVGTPDINYMTEVFNPDLDPDDQNDLDGKQLVWLPESGSASYYSFYQGEIPEDFSDTWEANLSGATAITTSPPPPTSYEEVTITNPSGVSLYDTIYSSAFISFNGYVTFVSGSSENDVSAEAHFELKGISALRTKIRLNPSGSIVYNELDDRFVVAWQDFDDGWYHPFVGPSASNTVMLEIFFETGKIRVTYKEVTTTYGVVGLSNGSGGNLPLPEASFVPDDFEESDITEDAGPLAFIENGGADATDPYPMYNITYRDGRGSSADMIYLNDGSIMMDPTPDTASDGTIALLDDSDNGILIIRRQSARVLKREGIPEEFPTIPAVYCPGDLKLLSTQANIKDVYVGGEVKRVIAKGAHVENIKAYNVGKVLVFDTAKSSSSNLDKDSSEVEEYLTEIRSGVSLDIRSDRNLVEKTRVDLAYRPDAASLDTDLNRVNVKLVGVGLTSFNAPNQQAAITLMSKKHVWRDETTGDRFLDVSLSRIPFDTDNRIEAGYLQKLMVIGGGAEYENGIAVSPESIVSNKRQNRGYTRIITRGNGMVVTDPNDVSTRFREYYSGTVSVNEIECRSDRLMIQVINGDLLGYQLEASGDITKLMARRGEILFDDASTPGTPGDGNVVAGIDFTETGNINTIMGDYGVGGQFICGVTALETPSNTGTIRMIRVIEGFDILGKAFISADGADRLRLRGDETAVPYGDFIIDTTP